MNKIEINYQSASKVSKQQKYKCVQFKTCGEWGLQCLLTLRDALF